MILVSPPLSTSNYHSWSRSLRMALLSKNKLMFIDEEFPTPCRCDVIYPVWERCNDLVLSWILKSLSPSIAQSVLWFDLEKDVWRILRTRFAQGDYFRKLIYKNKYMFLDKDLNPSQIILRGWKPYGMNSLVWGQLIFVHAIQFVAVGQIEKLNIINALIKSYVSWKVRMIISGQHDLR